jgi:mitochondrial fission protein ELM1
MAADSTVATRSGPGRSPLVWLLLGDKGGDNAQVRAVAEALPWPCVEKHLTMKPQWVEAKPRVKATLDHLDLSASDRLDPPWPDVILTIGRRPSMAALWVRQQSDRRCRIVLLGKPSGRMSPYDLIIVSSEIQLPRLPQVLHINLPLMCPDTNAVVAEAHVWRERLAGLARPLVGILVGGPTGNLSYGGGVSRRLLDAAREVVNERGGTPFISTSRRTPEAVVARIRAGLPDGARLFEWRPDATDNPYRALLGLADEFMVTGDSISMLVEVARMGKPLTILPLNYGLGGGIDQLRRSAARRLFGPDGGDAVGRLRRNLAQLAYRTGLVRHTRDLKAFHDQLIADGLARPWHGPAVTPQPAPDELPVVVARIRALWE